MASAHIIIHGPSGEVGILSALGKRQPVGSKWVPSQLQVTGPDRENTGEDGCGVPKMGGGGANGCPRNLRNQWLVSLNGIFHLYL